MCFFKKRKDFTLLSTKAQNLVLRGQWAALQEYIELIKKEITRKENIIKKKQEELDSIKKLYEELNEINTK